MEKKILVPHEKIFRIPTWNKRGKVEISLHGPATHFRNKERTQLSKAFAASAVKTLEKG